MIPLRVEAEFIVDVKREGHLSALCASILEEEAQKGSRGSFDSIVVTGQRSSIKIWGKFNLKGGAGLRQLREMSCPEGCSDPILVGVLGSQIVVVTSHNIYLVHIESEMWAVAYEAPCPILCAAWSCTRNDKGASLGKGAVLCLGFDGDGLRIMRISDEYEQGMVADNYQMQPFHQISERFHILPADAGLPPRSSTPTGDPSAWCQSRRRGKIGCHIHALSQLTNEDSRGTIVLGISQEHGSPHGIVIMWDTWTGRALFSLPVPAPNPRKLHWSPTSSMLAVSCDVGSVQQQSASPEYDEGASLVLVYLLDPASKSGTCLLRKKFEGEIANIHLMSGLPDLCSASLSSQTSPVLAVIHSDGKVSMEPVTGDDRILRFNRHQCQRGRLSSGHILQLRGTYIIATDTKLSLLAQPAAPVWSGEIDKGRISALSFIFNQDSRHEPSWEAIRSKLAACVAARGEESQVCRTDGSTARCSPPCMTPGVGDNCMPSAWYISSAMKLCVAGWATGGLQVINVESMRSVPVHWTVSGGGITSVTVMPAMAGLCHSRPLLLAGSQDGSLTLGPIGGCGPMSGDACYKLCTPSSRQSPILAIRTFLDAGKDQSAPFHHPFFILCCSEDGNISVWGVPALITDRHPAVSAESNWPLSLVGRMQVGDSNDSSWITCVELLSRDRCMVCCSDGSVEIWEVPMSARGAARILSAPLWSKRMKESIKCVSVSPPMVCGVRVLAAIGEEGEVQLWRKNPGPASEELILIGRSQFSASFDAVALASLSRTSMTVGIALAKGRDVIFFQSSSLALSGVSRSLELEGLNVLPNLFARRRMLESKHLLAPLSSTPSCKQARDFVANGPQLRGATILLDGSGLSGGAVNTLSKQGSKSKTSVIEYRSTTRGSVRIDKRYKLMRQSASAPSTLVAEMDQLPDEASSKLHEVSVPSFSQEQPSLGTEAYDDDYDGTDGNGSDDDGGESEAGQGDGEIPSSLSIPIEPCRRNSTITTSKCMPFLSTKRRRPFQTDTSNLFGASTGMVGAGLAVPLGYSDSQLRCSLHKWKRMRKRPSKRRSTEGSRQRQSLLLPPVTATYITELSQEGAEKEIIMLAADCTHGASQRAPLRRRVVEWSPWVVDDDYHEPSHQKSIDPLAPPPQYICDLFLSLSLGEPWLRLDGALQWELVQRAIAEGVISLYAVKSEFKKAYGGRHKGKNKHDMHDFERFHNFVKEEYFAAPTMELLLRSVGDSSIVLEARGNKKGQVVCIALPRGMQISPLIQSLRNGGSSSQDLISALAVQTALDPKAVFVAPKRALFGPHNQATVEIWGMNPETAYDIYAYAEHDDVGATEGSSSTLEAVQNTLCQVFTLAYTPKEHAHASDIEISWSSLEEAEQAAEVGAAARDRSVKSIATKSNIAVPSEDDFERAKMDPQARNRILAFTKWWAVKGGKEARKDFLQREVRFAFQSPDIRAQAEVDGLSMPDLSVDELQQQSKSSSPSWIFFCAWYSGKAQPTGRMSQTDFSKERMKRRTSFLLARVQRVTQAVDKVRNLLILTRGARKSVSGVEDQKSNTKEKLLRARSKALAQVKLAQLVKAVEREIANESDAGGDNYDDEVEGKENDLQRIAARKRPEELVNVGVFDDFSPDQFAPEGQDSAEAHSSSGLVDDSGPRVDAGEDSGDFSYIASPEPSYYQISAPLPNPEPLPITYFQEAKEELVSDNVGVEMLAEEPAEDPLLAGLSIYMSDDELAMDDQLMRMAESDSLKARKLRLMQEQDQILSSLELRVMAWEDRRSFRMREAELELQNDDLLGRNGASAPFPMVFYNDPAPCMEDILNAGAWPLGSGLGNDDDLEDAIEQARNEAAAELSRIAAIKRERSELRERKELEEKRRKEEAARLQWMLETEARRKRIMAHNVSIKQRRREKEEIQLMGLSDEEARLLMESERRSLAEAIALEEMRRIELAREEERLLREQARLQNEKRMQAAESEAMSREDEFGHFLRRQEELKEEKRRRREELRRSLFAPFVPLGVTPTARHKVDEILQEAQKAAKLRGRRLFRPPESTMDIHDIMHDPPALSFPTRDFFTNVVGTRIPAASLQRVLSSSQSALRNPSALLSEFQNMRLYGSGALHAKPEDVLERSATAFTSFSRHSKRNTAKSIPSEERVKLTRSAGQGGCWDERGAEEEELVPFFRGNFGAVGQTKPIHAFQVSLP